MKLHNTTKVPTAFLRKMVLWVIGNGSPTGRLPTTLTHVWVKGSTVGTSARRVAGRSGWRVGLWLGPVEQTDEPGAGMYAQGRLFKAILELNAALRPTALPEGDLGLYRQEVGGKFTANAEALVADWKAAVVPTDPLKKQKDALKLMDASVRTWTRRHKLATTKLKVWTRRRNAAAKALQAREQQIAATGCKGTL